MSLDAAAEIRADLASEAKTRTRRGVTLTVVWVAAAVALAIGLKPREDLLPSDALAQTIAGAFVLFGAVISFSPGLRFGRMSASAIGLIAVFSPLLAARAMGDSNSIAAGTFGCMGSIVVIGFVAMVAGRIVLGATRRRFGGAPVMQGVAAAMVASLAVGLHCPMSDLVHLLTHAAGILIVAFLLRRLIFAVR